MIDALAVRRAGILLHPTSLPGPGSRGALGADAYRFLSFLRAGGFTVWQTLPLGPVDESGSPYGLRSTMAGDPSLIDIPELRNRDELPAGLEFDSVLDAPDEAYRSFSAACTARQRADFMEFARREREWLVPYALFGVFERRFGGEPWWHWTPDCRDPAMRGLPKSLGVFRNLYRGILLQQYLFDLQWSQLKRRAEALGVYFFGDIPFYVDLNSVDVWWFRSLFRLQRDGSPEAVAGVPPDYFSADGQLWGNPLYDWEEMHRTGYKWWIDRIAGQLKRFDLLRIDHFRALDSYWEIPASASTARTGRWRAAYGDDLLTKVRQRLGKLPLVAEDLGLITDAVRDLRDRHDLPGMVVLQFAFDGDDDNPYLPENHRTRAVCYTGTHDNDTTAGWWAGLDRAARGIVSARLGVASFTPEALIEAAYASRARLSVVPMQDLLGLGSEARMNTPGTEKGNWQWRFRWSDVPSGLQQACRDRARRHGRLPETAPPPA